MPVSRKRKKPSYAPATSPSSGPKKKGPSPVWLAPLMLALFGIGVLWLVTFYITQGDMPLVSDLGNANLLVGFGFIIAGFAVSTQWRRRSCGEFSTVWTTPGENDSRVIRALSGSGQSSSRMVALAWPPPSHMVCRP